ncbi:MAG: methionine biosynthesis protein MetW [Candidatus Omnitrophica bacterium]|nr:methionine biosynthesis protein MetW [Candidatus Omnitrophota bacterium]
MNIPLDYQIISSIIKPDAQVLDLGCGTGDLMFLLANEKHASVQGIELDDQAIYACVAKGLSVFHGDIDSGLPEYPDKSFDYVIINQSLQQVKNVDLVIKEALRVGKQVIVGFPNFAFVQARWMLTFRGKAPVTSSLPYRWNDTPNRKFLSISDFKDFCRHKNIKIEKAFYLGKKTQVYVWPNLFAANALFVLSKI